MIKLYCDVCGKQTDKNFAERYVDNPLGEWNVVVIIHPRSRSLDDLEKHGSKVICRKCLKELAKKI
jgi:hypothetical protein